LKFAWSMFSQKQPKQIIMKKLLILFCLLSMNTMAQLDGNISGGSIISGNAIICRDQSNCVPIQFQGSGGRVPYTFIYELNGNIDTVSTIESYSSCYSLPTIDSNSTSNGVRKYFNNNEIIQNINANAGIFKINLISISDKDTTIILNKTPYLNFINPYPIQIPTISACFGQEITIDPAPFAQSPIGFMYWHTNNDVVNGQTLKLKVTQSQNISIEAWDNNGCAMHGWANINMYDKIVQPSAIIDSAACNNGSIELKNIDSTYKFNWVTGQQKNKLENIIAGNYKLNITDKNGCSASFLYVVPKKSNAEACGKIAGNVYYDLNKNCSKDSEDKTAQYRTLIANPGEYIAITNQKGEYEFALPYGTYSISEVNSDNEIASCLKEQKVTLDSVNTQQFDVNFYDTAHIQYDVMSDLVINEVRPGFTFNVYPKYSNKFGEGDFTTEKTWFTFPDSITILTCNFPYTISNDTVYFKLDSTYSNHNPIILQVKAARRIKLGGDVTFCAGIEGSKSESNTQNNITCITLKVTGSYDPNDKKLFVNGIEKSGDILVKDTILDYQIRFQNTGNADAVNIYVLDTISKNLDLSSFEFISSSHACDVIYLGDRVYKFDFPNIHLIDSITNEPLSHGYIKYRIKQNKVNILGTEIKNTAYIYFDFNDPVVTNTTLNTVSIETKSLGIHTNSFNPLKAYPNPVNSQLTIENNEAILGINIVSLDGKIMKQITDLNGSTVYTIHVDDLQNGLYVLEIVGASSTHNTRIIKQD